MTTVLSILHRASGIILAFGALLMAYWFWAVMSGADSYAVVHGFLNSWFGKGLLIIWTLCHFYHLCNGMRHLVWDTGHGLELSQAYLGGKIVLVATVILTLLVWVL